MSELEYCVYLTQKRAQVYEWVNFSPHCMCLYKKIMNMALLPAFPNQSRTSSPAFIRCILSLDSKLLCFVSTLIQSHFLNCSFQCQPKWSSFWLHVGNGKGYRGKTILRQWGTNWIWMQTNFSISAYHIVLIHTVGTIKTLINALCFKKTTRACF